MRIRKKIGVQISVMVFSVALASQLLIARPAHAWGDAIPAMLMHEIWIPIYDNIWGAILGGLKAAAIQVLNSQVNSLIGGGAAGQALFITDYNQFLINQPISNANVWLNDIFTLSYQGKSSLANYISAADTVQSIAGNYPSYLQNQVRKATVEYNPLSQAYNLDQYTANPKAMFEGGSWRAFNALMANPLNNEAGSVLMFQDMYQKKVAAEQAVATLKAQSSGYLPVEKNGITVTPPDTVAAIVADVKTLGNKAISAASNPAELFSGAIMAGANYAINSLIQTGIGKVQANIQRQVNSVNTQITTAQNQAQQQFGPAANFINSVSQKTNVNVNTGSATPPQPSGALPQE